jgi:hypothetical protein
VPASAQVSNTRAVNTLSHAAANVNAGSIIRGHLHPVPQFQTPVMPRIICQLHFIRL